MRAVHPLLVLVAFTVAAVVTYAVVLALLTAASACRGEQWLDEQDAQDTQDAQDAQDPADASAGGDGAMLAARPTDSRR